MTRSIPRGSDPREPDLFRDAATHLARLLAKVHPLAWIVLTSLALSLLAASQAHAAIRQPYGGCDEAYFYPLTQGAADCRDLGWVVPFTRVPPITEVQV